MTLNDRDVGLGRWPDAMYFELIFFNRVSTFIVSSLRMILTHLLTHIDRIRPVPSRLLLNTTTPSLSVT
jgi:hypothetical protein